MTGRRTRALMMAPALVLGGGLFAAGLAGAVAQSLGFGAPLGRETGVSIFAAYGRAVSGPEFLPSLGLTFWIAGAATLLSAILATAAACLLRAAFFGRSVVTFLFQSSLTVPHAVMALGLFYLLGQSGSFARLGHAAGLIARPADFPALLFDPWAAGVILHYVWKEVPFIALILLARMRAVGPEPEETARALGASGFQAFRHVGLPLLAPAIASSSLIVFAFAFGSYEVPVLLGASYPPTLPVLAYQRFVSAELGDRPEAMALAVIIAALSAAAVAALLLLRRGPGRG